MIRFNITNIKNIHNNRQQKLLQLIRLLKMIKYTRFNNNNKKSKSYDIRQNLLNYKKQILEMRSHYIDIFIENKKKEMESIREIMNININIEINTNENDVIEKIEKTEKLEKTETKQKKKFIKKTAESHTTNKLVQQITEKTVKEITGKLLDEDFLNDTINEIVEKVVQENGSSSLLDEKVIQKIVKHKIQQENEIKENYTYEAIVLQESKEKIKKQKTLSELENVTAKILVVIACHTNNNIRFNSIASIMKCLEEVDNIDIIIVNSANTHLSKFVQNAFKNKYFKYLEMNNDNYFGFTKWHYGVKSVDITKYKFTTFINDSILVHYSLKHFFDYTRLTDVDLYGYNNSTQIHHHYQTYLFSIKNSNLQQFIKMINDNKTLIKTYFDAVTHYELKLLDYYPNRDCFLKIAYLPSQKGNNIFFNNDFLYVKLRDSGLLPFTKLKRIS